MNPTACHHGRHDSHELRAAADAVGYSARHAARIVRRLSAEGPSPDPWADFQRFLLARSALVAERTLIEFLLAPALDKTSGNPMKKPHSEELVNPDVVAPYCFLPHDAERPFYPFGVKVGPHPDQGPPRAELRYRASRISQQIAHLTWVGVLEPRQWTFEKIDRPLRGLERVVGRLAESGSPLAGVLDEHLRSAWETLGPAGP